MEIKTKTKLKLKKPRITHESPKAYFQFDPIVAMTKVAAINTSHICHHANHAPVNGILWRIYMQNHLFAIMYQKMNCLCFYTWRKFD